MIHILFMILKIIGIILLAILAICLLILFFPVTYQVRGQLNENNYRVSVRCGWLFHLIHFGGKFTNQEHKACFRILGIPINLLKEKNKKEPKEKKCSDNKVKKEVLKVDEQPQDNISNEKTEQIQQGKSNYQEEEQHEKENNKPDEIIEDKKTPIDKIKDLIRTVHEWIQKVAAFLKNALKNLKATYNKAKEFKAFVKANTTKEAYRSGKKIVLKAIKHIFPRKIRADIQLGFEEPDITGKVLGYIAMLFAVFHINPKKISIEPYFDKNVIKGNIKIKGHFLIGVLLIYVLKFYFKKEIHDIIKKFS
ncbi:MAG: DUF2953 domain-containing protein [Eubacterium sp.]|nr:DUF2953 domain-containing protein [Eubacterium sp.]